MIKGTLIVESGKPLQFKDEVELPDSPPIAHLQGATLIGKTLRVYQEAAQKLLKEKYACFAEMAPMHLRSPCTIFIFKCSDGIFVRFDAAPAGPSKAFATERSDSLGEFVPSLSDHFIRFGDNPTQPDSNQLGPKVDFSVTDAKGATKESWSVHPVIYATTRFPDGFQIPSPPTRPICLVSVHNELNIQLGGLIGPADAPVVMGGSDVQQFMAHTRLKLPVGWQAIEIYPILGDEHWKSEYAAFWAELDILAIVAQRNLQEKQLADLDPRAETRRQYGALLAEFESLLQGPEPPIHQFLRQHPELISPTCEKHWSKVPFGATVSDFVFREPYNDYELVEIEAPGRKIFRQDGQQHGDLTHAINQITDWVRYIEDNKKTVELELGLSGISTNPRRLIVMGRSQSLTEENRRKLATLQNEQPKLRFLTYDDLLAGARSNLERILGPLSLIAQNAKLYYFN